MKRKRWSLMVAVFGLICLVALSGCDDDDDGGEPANTAFNGTFSGNLTTIQGGVTSTDTTTVILTVGSPLSGTFSADGQTGTIAGEATGDTATFTATFNRDCPGSAEGTATLLDNDTLSVEVSGSDCDGPFTSTGTLNRVIGGSGPGLESPLGIAVEADGSLVVADRGLGAVVRVDPVSGDRTILSDARTGTGPGFQALRGLAVEADGNLVVVDFELAAVVRVDPVSGDRTILSGANTGSGL